MCDAEDLRMVLAVQDVVDKRNIEVSRQNDTLLLITGWLIGLLVRNRIPIPDEVQHLLIGLGIVGYEKKKT